MLARTLGPLGSIARDATLWLWIFSLAANVLLLAAPIYMIQIYGQILPGQGMETLIYLTSLILLALALYGLIESVRSVMAQKLSARYDLAASERLLRGALATASGDDRAETLRDVSTVRQVIASRVLLALYDLPFAPLFLAILFVAHPTLGWTAVAGCGLLVALAIFNSRALGDDNETATIHQVQAARFAAGALRQDESIRAMGMAPHMFGRWEREVLLANIAANRAGITNAAYFGVTRFVRQGLQILMLGIGAYLVLSGQMAAGLIFAASLLSGRALQPIEQLIGGWRQLGQGLAAHRRIVAVLDKQTETSAAPTLELPAAQGHLALEAAAFAVLGASGPVVLVEPVDLAVAPGEILAIMGPSGAGKSTLARLMAGIVSPSSGTVRLDGFALEQWDESQRGAAIGYVGQGGDLPDGTVAEMIARFDPSAADGDIVDAAHRANAHHFIARLPQGYQTIIGRGGVRLSGGQAQRLLLARALFGRPRVLILDEPNAYLDGEGEAALTQALVAERARGSAIVIVSQRKAVLAVADRLAIVRDGRIESCSPVERAAPVQADRPVDRSGARVTNFRRITTAPAAANSEAHA